MVDHVYNHSYTYTEATENGLYILDLVCAGLVVRPRPKHGGMDGLGGSAQGD